MQSFSFRTILASVLGSLGMSCAGAQNSASSSFFTDYTFSFFGTAGYSISDRPYAYTKIDQNGTFDSVSRLGAQLDAQFTPRFGLTLQGELSAANNKDNRYRPQLNWLSVTYRAKDNWLLRLGRMRLPALLYTQNSNVGLSYVQARLPQEVYGLSPTFDFNGVSSTYSWDFAEGMQSFSWDIYGGMSTTYQRVWVRNPIAGGFKQGANHMPRRMNVVGTFVTWEDLMENNVVRAGVHYVSVKDRNNRGFMKIPYALKLPNGIEVYPPVGGNRTDKAKFLLWGILADFHLGKGFYLTGEWANRLATNMTTGLNTSAFYVQLRKKIGDFTPYAYWAWSQSNNKARQFYKKMNVSTGIAQVDLFNSISADTLMMANQNTFAIGSSYDIGQHHRLKMEYAHVRVGTASAFVDARPMDNVAQKGINLLTASYNFLF